MSGETQSPSRIAVLLVDDHALVRAGLRLMLGGASDLLIVGEAASGNDAVAMTAYCRPDVVVMDVDMPDGNGVEATRAITSREPYPKVLILTMHAESDHLVSALRAGASGYVTKDAPREELIEAIHRIVRGEFHLRPSAAPLLAQALQRPARPGPQHERRAQFETLSKRQQKVLLLIARGFSGPEVGDALGVTGKTIDTYRHRIRDKLGLDSRVAYVKFALSAGLLTPTADADVGA